MLVQIYFHLPSNILELHYILVGRKNMLGFCFVFFTKQLTFSLFFPPTFLQKAGFQEKWMKENMKNGPCPGLDPPDKLFTAWNSTADFPSQSSTGNSFSIVFPFYSGMSVEIFRIWVLMYAQLATVCLCKKVPVEFCSSEIQLFRRNKFKVTAK